MVFRSWERGFPLADALCSFDRQRLLSLGEAGHWPLPVPGLLPVLPEESNKSHASLEGENP